MPFAILAASAIFPMPGMRGATLMATLATFFTTLKGAVKKIPRGNTQKRNGAVVSLADFLEELLQTAHLRHEGTNQKGHYKEPHFRFFEI
jgi:hypothetical protein